MNPTTLLTSSVIAAIVAALLNGFWNRRAAKKVPKTEMRADAYRDFVVYLVSSSVSNGAEDSLSTPNSQAFVEIKARLLLFGESNVVSAVATFLTELPKLNAEGANTAFVSVICEMRKSLLTGHGAEVTKSIGNLLSSK